MPISLRFILPLGIALAAIAYAVVPLVDRLTLQWFVRDLDPRSESIASAGQEPLAELVTRAGAKQKVQRYFDRLVQDQRIFALGYCDSRGVLVHSTYAFPKAVRSSGGGAPPARNRVVELAHGPIHVSAGPPSFEGGGLRGRGVADELSVA